MNSKFPKPILDLPRADIPIDGLNAYLLQGENNQIVFLEFEKNVDLLEHSHESQWEIILEGMVDVWIDGIKHTYKKGDRFFIPKGVKHSAKIYPGYVSCVFFNQSDRYKKKK